MGHHADDVALAVHNAGNIVHCTIGQASFEIDALKSNLVALIDALNRASMLEAGIPPWHAAIDAVESARRLPRFELASQRAGSTLRALWRVPA